MIRLVVENIIMRRGGRPILERCGLTLNPGGVAICGKSGCGKTTLLHTINGLIPHHMDSIVEGSVQIDGLKVSTMAPNERCRLVGIVMQNFEAQIITPVPMMTRPSERRTMVVTRF